MPTVNAWLYHQPVSPLGQSPCGMPGPEGTLRRQRYLVQVHLAQEDWGSGHICPLSTPNGLADLSDDLWRGHTSVSRWAGTLWRQKQEWSLLVRAIRQSSWDHWVEEMG